MGCSMTTFIEAYDRGPEFADRYSVRFLDCRASGYEYAMSDNANAPDGACLYVDEVSPADADRSGDTIPLVDLPKGALVQVIHLLLMEDDTE